jgi:hypothetical protein
VPPLPGCEALDAFGSHLSVTVEYGSGSAGCAFRGIRCEGNGRAYLRSYVTMASEIRHGRVLPVVVASILTESRIPGSSTGNHGLDRPREIVRTLPNRERLELPVDKNDWFGQFSLDYAYSLHYYTKRIEIFDLGDCVTLSFMRFRTANCTTRYFRCKPEIFDTCLSNATKLPGQQNSLSHPIVVRHAYLDQSYKISVDHRKMVRLIFAP